METVLKSKGHKYRLRILARQVIRLLTVGSKHQLVGVKAPNQRNSSQMVPLLLLKVNLIILLALQRTQEWLVYPKQLNRSIKMGVYLEEKIVSSL